MRYRKLIALVTGVCLAALSAGDAGLAATSTTSVTISIAGAMKVVVTPAAPAIACETTPGTVVATFSLSGGTGSPVSYSVTGSADFSASGANLVVASGGIAAADCGKQIGITVAATQ